MHGMIETMMIGQDTIFKLKFALIFVSFLKERAPSAKLGRLDNGFVSGVCTHISIELFFLLFKINLLTPRVDVQPANMHAHLKLLLVSCFYTCLKYTQIENKK